MIKKRTIYCDCCQTPVCEGLFFKTLLKPYAVIPIFQHLVLLDQLGIDVTDKRWKEDNHLCVDCYNKFLVKLKEVKND